VRRILQNALTGLVQRPLMNVAHWLGELGHDSASARLYSTLADHEPGPVRSAYLRYRSLLQENRFDEALAHFEEVVAAYPDAPTLYEYGTVLQQADRHLDAVDAFDRSLSLDLNRSASHAHRAFSLMQLGRWLEAEAGLRRALRHDPRNRLAWHDLGMTLAQLERLEDAVAAFQSALAIGPDVATSMSLAYVLGAGERFSEAEAVLREALVVDPDNALVIAELTGVLLRLERDDEAYALAAEANVRMPDHPAVVGTFVGALLAVDRIDEAVSHGERLVSLSDTAYGHSMLAWAYLESHQTDKAAAAMQRAETKAAAESEPSMGPDDLTAARVAVLSATGQHEAALIAFEQLRGKANGFYEKDSSLQRYVTESRSALGLTPNSDRPQSGS
jgi:tetratricopeptide (TPR) repeat protein